MTPSANSDRERRRTKVKKWEGWAKRLVNPRTLRSVIAVGVLVTRVLWLIYRIINFWRE